MTRIGLIGIVAGALSAAVIGFAGPAQADGIGNGMGGHDNGHGLYYYDRDHRNNPWLDQIFPSVAVPHVDTSVHH